MSQQSPTPNPKAVGSETDKKTLLNPGTAYQRQVIIVFVGLLFFWLLYFALVGLACWGIYLLWELPLVSNSGYAILLKVGSLAMGVMFLGFLLKFIFKSNDAEDKSMIEIKEAEQPRLFEFLRTLSKEIGCSFPGKVYVNHEINAKVFYHNPLLSLFFPVKKNLLIGLGLVNSLTLTELKAVLAHEFGHFSQGSMRLGSYVYMANRIIYDMVYSRDSWDLWLDRWRASDFRIAIFAWMLSPFVWLVRVLMKGLYMGLNMLQSSLSRQMEFHADRVAVYAAGSSAIVHALYRLEGAGEAYGFAVNQVKTAFDHQLYSNNLFFHQREAEKYLMQKHPEFKEKSLELVLDPTREKEAYLFSKDDLHNADMYASHPANYLREQNAKAFFVPGESDNRSAWTLFDNSEALSEKVSKHIFINLLALPKDTSFNKAEEVQAFIEEELKELGFDDRYQSYYGNRYLADVSLGKRRVLLPSLEIETEQGLNEAIKNLYNEDFIKKMAEIKASEERYADLLNLLQLNKSKVEYKGKIYTQPELKTAIERYKSILEEYAEWYVQRDELIFMVHLEAAKRLQYAVDEFNIRYDFQWKIQEIHYQLKQSYEQFIHWVRAIIEKNGIPAEEVGYYARNLSDHYKTAYNALHEASKLDIPELNNMEQVENLADFLCPNGLPVISTVTIDGASIQKFDIVMQETIGRCSRIFRKNLGKILTLQENIEARYKERFL